MSAIGWLILIIGVGVIIMAWQGKNPWTAFQGLLSGPASAANTTTK